MLQSEYNVSLRMVSFCSTNGFYLSDEYSRFDGAGFSIAGTKEVLSSIASDSMVGGGDFVNAVEVFWTPSERNEVLTSRDVLLDFPELIDL